MITLRSYVLDQWHTGTGDPAVLVNATTEEAIAQCNSEGIDFQAVLNHARQKGGPALRAMSFAERGKLLKGMSAALQEHREELIDLSIQNAGSTRGDAKFDIDGATGTLAAYAYFAKQLSGGEYLVDGEGVQLGRTARFWGEHLRVPRLGAAVHINAFNFPAWGQMEKVACAFLAGVPVIEKPGTATALVAWRTAEILVESGLLPEGSFQFICGSTGDLLDRLEAQDCMAFTGSSGTGAKLKGNSNVVQRNVRVNIEADSLNAAVLGPDTDPDSESYDLFLQNVALDMTQKTGQKCTAVRRILVPADRVDEVAEDLIATLQRTRVGDPSDSKNRMGPLSSAAQFRDVQEGIRRLQEHADTLCGGPEPIAEKGFFVAATLLKARDSSHPLFHSDEVFGPVATLLPYDGSAEEAIRLANLGGGGLVASLYSNDSAWCREVILGIGPWHGRVWVGSDRMASQSLPPGMVLPAMIHGGPGRAGGGEELGALRGLEFYMQRVAVQGFRGNLKAAFPAHAAEETAASSS
ncbi:MAG: 3,4-dehydroadipyl-CoA semialdehyde dehydrogenase [Planctomycetota bacterium]|nr:MAG: 3,4-dehydroadipyl-CoA semialdehyde dehydrogenase [Planctomycetota bacterium]